MLLLRGSNAFGNSSASAFTPATLFASAEEGAWYDPSDLSTVWQDSAGTVAGAVDSPVGKIDDKSGNANHAIQATAAARPILRQDGSGNYYLEFDGVDDYLRALFTVTQPWDRVSAIQQISWANLDRVFGSGNTGNGGNLWQRNPTPELAMDFDGTDPPINAGATVGTNAVVTERWNGASSQIAVNGGAYDTGTCVTTAPGGITLGATDLGARFGNVRIYGVIMIDRALTAGEIIDSREYLAGKCGVTL